MSSGEGSVFPRIAPEHPLAEAARIVNAYSEEQGIEATLAWLKVDAGAGELAYLGEQRALRAIAAASLDVNMGAGLHDAEDADTMARALVATPYWKEIRPLLVACYLDAFAIGWKGHELAVRDAEG